MASVTGLTIDDFERLPDDLAHNRELVDGELIDVPGNTGEHNGLRDCIIALLWPHIKQHNLGKVLSEQEYQFGSNARGPDVSFFGVEKALLFDPRRRVQRFVPDLAIEIVSQNDKFEALMKKARHYRRCGTKEVWIFSMTLREAFVLSEKRDALFDENQQFSSDLIPGFSIRIGDLFDRI